MKIVWKALIFIGFIFISAASSTQNAAAQDIVKDPICFTIRNDADFMIYGNLGTDFYTTPEGTQARHRSNFRLDAKGTKDEQGYPADSAEFCSYGPFYPDRKLDLQLRTLFPVFECRTKIDQGEIVIKAKRKADDSGFDMWAECFE